MADEKSPPPSVTGPPGPGDRFSPRNPLGIIALFVFLIEAIATVSLKSVVGTQYVPHLVWFIILYPTFIALAFFVVTPLQHERYLYPALALFLITGLAEKKHWWFYAVASITTFCNMVVILVMNSPDFAVQPGFWRDFVLQHLATITLTTIALALVNIGLLIIVITAYLRRMRRLYVMSITAPDKDTSPVAAAVRDL